MKEYLSFNVKQQAFHRSPYPSHQGVGEIAPTTYGWFDIEKIDEDIISEFIKYLEIVKDFPDKKLSKDLVISYFQEFLKVQDYKLN